MRKGRSCQKGFNYGYEREMKGGREGAVGKGFKIMRGKGDEEGEELGGSEVRFRKDRGEEVVGGSSGEVS
jgi:hypothetical protein